MKTWKQIIWLGILVFAAGCGWYPANIRSVSVNRYVAKFFETKYGYMDTEVLWERTPKYYKATFEYANRQTQAFFEYRGSWVYSVTEVAPNELPLEFKQRFQSGPLKAYTILEVKELNHSTLSDRVYVLKVKRNMDQQPHLVYLTRQAKPVDYLIISPMATVF